MSPTELSHPHPTVWQITLSNPPDNRLTPELLSSLASNLDDIEAEWRKASGKRDQLPPMSKKDQWGEHAGAGAVILTGNDKFFSNGLDFAKSMKNKRFFEEVFDPVLFRLMTFPLITIAAVNGHAFAGGMVMALACDFRIMTSGKGLMCMNEIQFGSPIPNSFAAFLSLRIPNPTDLRDTMLAKRWTQKELMEKRLIDEIAEPGDLIGKAVEMGKREGIKAGPGTWGQIKDSLYHHVMEASESNRKVLFPPLEAKAFWSRYEGKAKAKL